MNDCQLKGFAASTKTALATALCILAFTSAAANASQVHTTAEKPVAKPRVAIPFTAASAVLEPDGASYRVQWASDVPGTVQVFVGEGPEPKVTGEPVAMGAASASIAIRGLPPGRHWYFTLAPSQGAPLVVSDRALHLPSAHNLRDIGGYRTTDGRWVRMGLIYRSDQLDRISDTDLAEMAGLHIATVADLRTVTERASSPDRIPIGAKQVVLDVAADSTNALGGDMRKAEAAIAAGQGVQMLMAANREFVLLPSARSAYGTMLRDLADPSQVPFLYHCTAGKDRTGWATAVILTLLGVPRQTVIEDYLLSNVYLHVKNEAILAALARSRTPVKPEYLEAALTVRPEYLESAFAEVDIKYGSFDAYLRDGLGLTASDLQMLRERYLTK
ncbi:tyrosine-protein phosphatase (plasmid) [Novosphingobium sp. BL-8A]|uniref:tyrosine-protein phosphatase n=1 Tax=Novosphingobium sp. BL-8A TaxID=3127639 RepID=UPI0037564A97